MAGEQRRREIVETMLSMAGELGVERVTTRGLAQRLGVTEPALYRHFPEGKSGMWRALADTIGERMQTAWREALGGHFDSATAQLRALIQAQMRLIVDTPALPAILFSRTLHRDNAALRAGLGEVAGRFHAHVQHILEQGIRSGEFRSDLATEDAAWLLISVIQGTAIRWSLLERAFDLERQGSRVLEVALAGLQRPRPGRAT